MRGYRYQQRRLGHLLGKTGPYLQLILIIVESAAIIIVARVFELVLGMQATTTGVDPQGNNSVYIITFSMPQLLVRPFFGLFFVDILT